MGKKGEERGEDERLKILIVDDEEDFVESLSDLLKSHGYLVETAGSVKSAEKKIESFNADVVLLDIRLGKGSGIDLLSIIKESSPLTVCVMMTAYADVNSAVEALKEGAYDYLRKPLDPMDLLTTLNRCYEKLQLEQEKMIVDKTLWERNLELLQINKRLKAIVESTKNLTVCLRLGEMGQVLLEEFARNMAVEGGSLYIAEKDSLVLAHSLDPGHAPEKIDLPLEKGTVLEMAVSRGEPILIKDIEKEKNIIKSGWKEYTDSSALVFPVPDEAGKIIGIISLHSKVQPPFLEQDKEIGSILASYSCEALRAARATKDLEESEQRLELALTGADLGFWDWDLIDEKFEVNERMYKITGYTAEEIGDSFRWWSDNVYPEDKERIASAMVDHLEGRTPFYDVEQRVKNKSGEYVWTHSKGRIVKRDDKGKPVRLAGISRDITEHKRADVELKNSEVRWKNLFENSIDGAFTLDLKGNLTLVNRALAETLGYKKEEMIGKSYREFMTKEMADTVFLEHNQLFRTGKPIKNITSSVFMKNGVEIIVESNVNIILREDETVGFQGTIRDITDRVKAEREIKYLKEFSENIINYMNDPVDIINADFEVVFQNRRSIERFGNAEGRKCYENYGRKNPCEYCTAIRAIKEKEVFKREVEMEDGTFLEVHSSPILMPGGETCSIEIVRDITERKRSEKELKESEERLAEAQRIAHIGSWDLDFDTNTIYWSDEVYRLYNQTPETFKPSIKGILELVHPDDRESFINTLVEVLKNRREKVDFEFRTINPDENVHCLRIIGNIEYGPDGKILKMMGTIQDVTELKKVQDQLISDQKMKAVGTLAGGIAHDFNNILATILGYASFLKTKVLQGEPFYEGLDAIEKSSLRASELTSQLLAYSRKGKLEIKLFNINNVIKNVYDIISKTFEKTVEISLDTDDNIKSIEGDMSQMNQVVLNLAINSREAMPNGGKLTIRTFMEEVSEDIDKVDSGMEPGVYTCAEFTDTGVGMDEYILERIFEPYFSTRKEKGGTGLGMSVVYGIVKNHGGYISIKSSPGEGTKTTVYIPASNAEEVKEEEEKEICRAVGGKETILVIDDEDKVLLMIKDILGDAGYTVYTENLGEAGLKILKEKLDQVDLVILDIAMPDMRCEDILKRIFKIDRNMRVLLASGYSEEDQHHELIKMGAHGFIGKPFLADRILAKIREMLV